MVCAAVTWRWRSRGDDAQASLEALSVSCPPLTSPQPAALASSDAQAQAPLGAEAAGESPLHPPPLLTLIRVNPNVSSE